MNKLLCIFAAFATLTSCMSSYSLDGTTNVSLLDGRMLYLKVFDTDEMVNRDSCEVVHGKFHFSGSLDTATIASIYMDNNNLMPLVLEDGDISIRIDQTQMVLSGTPLNDSLYSFLRNYEELQMRNDDLVHKHDQAIMNGHDMQQVVPQLQQEAVDIAKQLDQLVTGTIANNFDNALGPGIFMIVTASYPFPEMRPWIVDVMSKATPRFKDDAYVRLYVSEAQHYQNLQNGLETLPQPPAQANNATPAPQPPTPNQMAKPAQ
ncbi:MAG: DUF4369 domain-containing protein [Prevotella sp.]|nr:DUF4369 domain-containing protein [Prevotella sp.]